MLDTIERLLSGDQTVTDNFVAAAKQWSNILVDIDTVTVVDLAERLTAEQSWFEHNCGGRWPGQEVMVLSGYGYLFQGDPDRTIAVPRGKKLAEAFEKSMVSIEVKNGAKRTAEIYLPD